MNRRDFLNAGLASSAVAAATALTAGEQLMASGKEKWGPQLTQKLDNLESRFDKLEHHHKNLIRVGALAFSLSTGIDLLTIL